RHTRSTRDWSSDVCSSDLVENRCTGTMFKTVDNLKFKPEAILELVSLVEAKTISTTIAQQVFGEMFDTGESPAAIVQKKGLAQEIGRASCREGVWRGVGDG